MAEPDLNAMLEHAAARLQAATELLIDGPDCRQASRLGIAGQALRRLVARATKFQRDHDVAVVNSTLDTLAAEAEVLRTVVASQQRLAMELTRAERTVLSEVAELAAATLRATVAQCLVTRGSGDVSVDSAIGRWRSQIERSRERPGTGAPHVLNVPEVRRVRAEVGELLMPAHDKYVLPAVEATGVWEPDEVAWLRQRAHDGMTVLNVGAHVGHHVLFLASHVGPQGLVIAVEPEPVNFGCLCANLDHNGARNVVPIHAAGAARTEVVPLSRSRDNSGDHRAFRRDDNDVVDNIDVLAIAIDDVMPDAVSLDLVVIDVQGTDHRVVEGLERTLRKTWPPMLVEFWPPGIRDAGDDPCEVLSYYRSLGYSLSVLEDPDVPVDIPPDRLVALAEGNRGNYVSLVFSRSGQGQ